MSADNVQVQSREEIEKQRRAERYGLTIKERRFINYYLRSGNAKESVRKAGYQVNDACVDAFASRLVRKVKIASVIKERIAQADIKADEVIGGFAEESRFDITDVLKHDGSFDFSFVKDSGLGRFLKKLKVRREYEKTTDEEGNETEKPVDIIEFEAYSAQEARKHLSKILGLEKKEVTINTADSERGRQVRTLRHTVRSFAADGTSVEEIWEYVAERTKEVIGEDVSGLRDEVLKGLLEA